MPHGTAQIVQNDEEIPLSEDEEEGEQQQQQLQQDAAATEATATAAQLHQPQSTDMANAAVDAAAAAAPRSPEVPRPPSSASAAAAHGGLSGEALAESDGRYSPPPVDAAEVAGQDVVNEEEDLRLLHLLRQQVGDTPQPQPSGSVDSSVHTTVHVHMSKLL